MSYFALLIKYKSGRYAIPIKKYRSHPAAKRSAKRRLKLNNNIEQITIIEQLSMFDISCIKVKEYV